MKSLREMEKMAKVRKVLTISFACTKCPLLANMDNILIFEQGAMRGLSSWTSPKESPSSASKRRVKNE